VSLALALAGTYLRSGAVKAEAAAAEAEAAQAEAEAEAAVKAAAVKAEVEAARVQAARAAAARVQAARAEAMREAVRRLAARVTQATAARAEAERAEAERADARARAAEAERAEAERADARARAAEAARVARAAAGAAARTADTEGSRLYQIYRVLSGRTRVKPPSWEDLAVDEDGLRDLRPIEEDTAWSEVINQTDVARKILDIDGREVLSKKTLRKKFGDAALLLHPDKLIKKGKKGATSFKSAVFFRWSKEAHSHLETTLKPRL
jgi:hypothetical protein